MTPIPTAAARVSGTIKALEWHDGAEFCGQPMSYAETEFGPWIVVAYTGRDGRWTSCDPTGNDSYNDWDTASAAKAESQADYEARILAAIQPDPEPKPVAWASFYKGGKIASVVLRPDYYRSTPLYTTPSSAGTVSVEAGRLPTQAEAVAAAKVLLRCNGADLDEWTDGEWGDGAADALRALAGEGGQ